MRWPILGVGLTAAASVLVGGHHAQHRDVVIRPPPPERTRLATAYARVPLGFEQNRGQTDRRVRFLSRRVGLVFEVEKNRLRIPCFYRKRDSEVAFVQTVNRTCTTYQHFRSVALPHQFGRLQNPAAGGTAREHEHEIRFLRRLVFHQIRSERGE